MIASPPLRAPLCATLLAAWLSLATSPAAGSAEEATPPAVGPYTIEALTVPEAATGVIAAVDFTPDGRPMLLTREGRVWLGGGEWTLWSEHRLEGATGLLAAYFPKSIYVTHATGITRLFDTDDDGRADFVKAVIPAWRFGTLGELFRGSPAVLPEGDLLIPPNVTSGEWSGLVMRVPEARPVSPWLTGFSQVSAPAPGPASDTWAVAGRWKSGDQAAPATAIWVVAVSETEPAPASDTPPVTEKTNEMAEEKEAPDPPSPIKVPPPAIHLPGSLMPTTPIRPAFPPPSTGAEEASAAFGVFSGQGFVAGESSKRLLRLMPQLVNGVWQGAVTDFAAIESPEPGIGFLHFSPGSDQLLAGQGGHALSISPAGGSLFAVRTLRLASDGFEVTFTRPIDRTRALDVSVWRVRLWSPDKAETESGELALDDGARVVIDSDGLAATLQLPEDRLITGRVYLFDLSSLPSESGESIVHGPVYYTLNALHPAPAYPDQPVKATPLEQEEESAPEAPESTPETVR